MQTEKKIKTPPGEYLIASAACVVLLMAVLCFIPHKFDTVFLICFVCFCTFVMWGCARVDWLRSAVPALFIAGFLFYLFSLDVKTDFLETVEFYIGYCNWVYQSVWVHSVPPAEYLLLSGILIGAALSITVYSLVRLRTHFSVLLLIGAAVFMGLQILSASFPKTLMLLYLMLVAVYAVWQGGMTKLSEELARGKYLLLCLPLCAVIALSAWLMPVFDSSVGKPFVEGMSQIFTGVFGVPPVEFDEFSFSQLQGPSSFFGELSGRLGGPNNASSDRLMLYIQGDDPLYLKGRVSEIYTGNEWQTGKKDTAGYERSPLPAAPPYFTHLAMTNNTAFAAELQTPIMLLQMSAVKTEDVEVQETVIFFWDVRTRSIFLPSGTVDLEIHPGYAGGASYRIDENTVMTADKMMRKEFSYSVYTPKYNLSREDWDVIYNSCSPELLEKHISDLESIEKLINMYNSAEEFAADIIRKSRVRLGNNNETRDIYEEAGKLYNTLQENIATLPFWRARQAESERIHDEYTQLPETVPERVKRLAHEIAGPGEQGMTDYQKARAVEAYLIENYTYNLEVPETPENREFTDYFLFELGEGYCTYFATAMTVLCRELDVPVRYVEGFAPGAEKIEDFYYVTGAQAHAWPEIYIDLCGWVAFEPTPALNASYNNNYFMGGTDAGSEEYIPQFDEMPDMELYPEQAFESEALSENDPGADTGNTFKLPGFVIVLICLALGAFCLPLIHLCRRKYYDYVIYRKTATPAQVEWMYTKYVKLFARLGIRRERGETALEYGRRVDKYGYLYGASMEEIGNIYGAARFGGIAPGADDRKLMLLIWENRGAIVRTQIGRRMRWVYKNLLGYL